MAAALITLGAVTDIFDGLLARMLGTQSSFGALFDTFTDYLCFVVAPWALTRALIKPDGQIWIEVLIGIPLLTAAIRYARNSLIIATQKNEVRELPGLATVFFAFLPVAAVFLEPAIVIGEPLSTGILIFLVVGFSVLMITPVRYPKLASFRVMTAPVAISLIAMPFIGTRILALAMTVVGLLYVFLSPLLRSRS